MRVKAYKTAIDDDAIRAVAAWITASGRRPMELHISDCAVSDEGLRQLIESLRVRSRTNKDKQPLWIQLGGNSGISRSLVDEFVASGDACLGLDRNSCRPGSCRWTAYNPLVHLIGANQKKNEKEEGCELMAAFAS